MKANVSSKSHAAQFFDEAAKNPDTAGQRKPYAPGGNGQAEPKPRDKARRPRVRSPGLPPRAAGAESGVAAD